jgi:hypothetical protein
MNPQTPRRPRGRAAAGVAAQGREVACRGGHRRGACGDRLPLAEARPGLAAGAGRGRQGGPRGATPARPAPGALAQPLPVVPGEGGRSHHGKGKALLALWSLAALRMGQLAAALPAQLQALRRRLLLVPQPKEFNVQRLRASLLARPQRLMKAAREDSLGGAPTLHGCEPEAPNRGRATRAGCELEATNRGRKLVANAGKTTVNGPVLPRSATRSADETHPRGRNPRCSGGRCTIGTAPS